MRGKEMAALLCTLLLLGLGAELPRLTAQASDRRLEREVTRREDPSVSLALAQKTGFFETLALYGVSYPLVELPEGYHMTAEEASAAAVAVMEELGEAVTDYDAPEVTPLLFTSTETPGVTGVFWRCVWRWNIQGGDITLWLDDQTGYMVSVQVRQETSTVAIAGDVFPAPVIAVAEYCRKHYPVEEVKLAIQEGAKTPDSYLLSLLYSQDGEELVYNLPLYLQTGWLIFN